MFFFALVSGCFGACLASFALAAAERTMQEKKWWGMSRSVCEACKKELSAFELIPIFSYLFLKGRCRNCGAKIPKTCFAAELAGALCGIFFVLRFGCNFFALALCHTALLFLIFSAATDLKSGYIYDNWAYAGCFAGLALRFVFGGFRPLLDGVFGAFSGFALMFAIYLCSRKKGMGLGDAYLMLTVGAVLGFKLTILALYATFIAGGLYAISMLLMKKASRKTALPLAPFLAGGTIIALLVYPHIFNLVKLTADKPF